MSNDNIVNFVKLRADAILPEYKTSGSAGADVFALLLDDVVIKPHERVLIATGIAMAMPAGYEAQIRSRSGLAFKNGIMVLNSPGTIDNDYRGELKILLCNMGSEDFVVQNGMRIAQIVFCKYEQMFFAETASLEDTVRGVGGFGSTGIK